MTENTIRRLKHFAMQLKDAGFVSIVLAFMDERFAWDFERFSEAEIVELEKMFHSIEEDEPETNSIFSFSNKPKQEDKKDIKAVAEVSTPEKKSDVKVVEAEADEVVEYEAYDESVKVVSERIDRNGTKHQEVIVHCNRCGGAGGSDAWIHTGRTCFKCGGTGKQGGKRKIYTVKHAEKLRKQREKREEKKRQERMSQAEENNKSILAEWGYDQEKIHVVVGDTFSIKDELKEAGAHWGDKVIGWYFSEKPAKWETFELEVKNLIEYNNLGEVHKKGKVWEGGYEELVSYVNNARKKITPESNWIGEAGERKDLELKIISSFGIETSFGWSCINKLQDAEGNIFIWKTGMDLADAYGRGEVIKLKGTIKEHSEYRDEKQTVLTRCKVMD